MNRFYFNFNISVINSDKLNEEINFNEVKDIWDCQMLNVIDLCDPSLIVKYIETEGQCHYFIAKRKLDNNGRNYSNHYSVYGYSDNSDFEEYKKLFKRKMREYGIDFTIENNIKIYCNINNPYQYVEYSSAIKNNLNIKSIMLFTALTIIVLLIFIILCVSLKRFEEISFSIFTTFFISLLIEFLNGLNKNHIKKSSIDVITKYEYIEDSATQKFNSPINFRKGGK